MEWCVETEWNALVTQRTSNLNRVYISEDILIAVQLFLILGYWSNCVFCAIRIVYVTKKGRDGKKVTGGRGGSHSRDASR